MNMNYQEIAQIADEMLSETFTPINALIAEMNSSVNDLVNYGSNLNTSTKNQKANNNKANKCLKEEKDL